VIAEFGDVVGRSFRYLSCDPGHERDLLFEVPFVHQNGRCPWYCGFSTGTLLPYSPDALVNIYV